MKAFVSVLLVTLTHINHAIALGFIFTNGIYQVVFLENFSRGSTLTSWVSSVQLGMLCLAGPLASLMIGHLGSGITISIGAVIASFGIGVSAFTTSVEQLIVTFGFLSGTGFSLVFTASLCVIPEKFTTYRLVASGISMSGAGIGSVVWSWVSRCFLNTFGWRSALLISCGMSLQMCVTGAVISLYCKKPEASVTTESKTDEEVFNKAQSNKSIPGLLNMNTILQGFNNNKMETKHQLIPQHKSLMNLKLDRSSSSYCLTEKRTDPCALETRMTASQNDVTKRQHRIDSFFGKSFTSIHELFVAIHYDQLEEKTRDNRFRKILESTKDVLTDGNFILLSVNVFLFCFGLSVVYTHVAAYSASVGRTQNEINAVLSAIGLSNLVGRIMLGVIGHHCKCLHIVILYSGSYLLSGVGTLSMIWWSQAAGLITCATAIGFFTGAFAGVLTELTCLLLGASRFFITYGYLLVFMGFGFVLGGPAAGFAYDHFQYYPASLYIGGAAFIASSIVILPTYISLR